MARRTGNLSERESSGVRDEGANETVSREQWSELQDPQRVRMPSVRTLAHDYAGTRPGRRFEWNRAEFKSGHRLKPLTQEQTDQVIGAKLRTCQRLLLSAAQNDPTLLTYDPWQSALLSVGQMITKDKNLIQETEK